MKKAVIKLNKTESWFFEKINKIDKLLARLNKEEESNQQNQRWKRRSYDRQCRHTKDRKRLL